MLRSIFFKFLVLLSVSNTSLLYAQTSAMLSPNANEGMHLVSDYIRETCPHTVLKLNEDEDYRIFLKSNLLSSEQVCGCTNQAVLKDSKLNLMANDILKPPKNKQTEEFVRRYMVTRVQQAIFACIGSALEDRMKHASN